jgi:hypothetical protein
MYDESRGILLISLFLVVLTFTLVAGGSASPSFRPSSGSLISMDSSGSRQVS